MNSGPRFVAIYRRGPGWLPGKPLREQPLKPHLDYLLGLHRQGKLTMGGPFGDETGGLVLLDVANLEDASALIAADPAIIAGLLQAEVKAWMRLV